MPEYQNTEKNQANSFEKQYESAWQQGSPFSDRAVSAFTEQMFADGFLFPGKIEADGTWHRFYMPGGNKSNVDGAYLLKINGESAQGCYFSFRDQDHKFHFTSGQKPSFIDQFKEFEPASSTHPYLVKKQIPETGFKQTSDGRLVVPMIDQTGKCCGLQYISTDGSKRYAAGSIRPGSRLDIHGDETTVFICEGVATGLSIHLAEKRKVVVAWDAGNLAAVGTWVADTHPNSRIIFAADNDCSGKRNVGVESAKKAADAIGADIVVPEMPDGSKCDFNDIFCKIGLDECRRQLAIENNDGTIFRYQADIQKCLSKQPSQIEFLVKDRIPMGRGILITAVGGSSKTRMMYHVGIGVVAGRLPWGWEISTRGKAVLILTEDTEEDVHRILYYMARDLELSAAQIKDDLIVYPLAGKQFKLLTKTVKGTVERSREYHVLVEKIKSIGGVVFVGIDPALSISEGDELDQGHQRELGKMIDDLAIHTGAACALVAHATKASLNSAEMSSYLRFFFTTPSRSWVVIS